MADSAKKLEPGKRVTLDITLKLANGELISSSKEEGPLTFTVGDESVVPGLEAGLLGLCEGESFDIQVAPEEAYGVFDEDAYELVPSDAFADEIEEGEDYVFEDEDGEPIIVTVAEISEEGVLLDFNHPLAGEALNFTGVITKVED